MSGDCVIAFDVIRHFDERKPSGLSRITIGYDVHPVNCAIRLKERTEILLGRTEA